MTKTQARTQISRIPIKIKKYVNRRLYNTSTSKYITLDDLSNLVKEDIEFVVHEVKTGEDITRQILTQIVVDKESGEHHLLPTNFLKQLISFYGGNFQWAVPKYLEQAMENFYQNKNQIKGLFPKKYSGIFNYSQIEELRKNNLSIIEKAYKTFLPFSSQKTADRDDVSALRRQVNDLEKQIERLSGTGT
jgi:polyhydroxyalkanoate synthesis repressor PhaR